MFIKIRLCFVSLFFGVVKTDGAVLSKVLKFNLLRVGNEYQCLTENSRNFTLIEEEQLTLQFRGNLSLLHNVQCHLSTNQNNFLSFSNLQSSERIREIKINATKSMRGKWICIINSHTKTIAKCNTEVEVLENSNKEEESNLYIYVAAGVGIVVLLIIIAQTIIIIHFKRKAKISAMRERLESSTKSMTAEDTTRYSILPGEKKMSKLFQKKKRAESGIYESLENLQDKANEGTPTPEETPSSYRDISRRPPFPLPTESGEENVYDNEEDDVAPPSVNPTPPPVDTLPRKQSRKPTSSTNSLPKKGQSASLQKQPKSQSVSYKKQPTKQDVKIDGEMEEYDYTDNIEFVMPQDIEFFDNVPRPLIKIPAQKPEKKHQRSFSTRSLFKKKPAATPSIPPTKPHCKPIVASGAPVMSELDTILRKRRETAASRQPEITKSKAQKHTPNSELIKPNQTLPKVKSTKPDVPQRLHPKPLTKEFPRPLMKEPPKLLTMESPTQLPKEPHRPLTKLLTKKLMEPFAKETPETLDKELPTPMPNEPVNLLTNQPPKPLPKKPAKLLSNDPPKMLVKEHPTLYPEKSPNFLTKEFPKTFPKEPSRPFSKEPPKMLVMEHPTLYPEVPPKLSKTLAEDTTKLLTKEPPKVLTEYPKLLTMEPPKTLANETPKSLMKEAPKTLPKGPPKPLPKDFTRPLKEELRQISMEEPGPTPLSEDIYDAVHSDTSDEEDWTYEPLPDYDVDLINDYE